MVSVTLGTSDWRRGVANEADILVRNRYFEANPTNLQEQVALISRPGLKRFKDVGTGPIRALYSQPGSFNDALFIVSGDTLWRLDPDETLTSIGSGIYGTDVGSFPSMTATGKIEAVPEYLYLADGRNLWLYDGSTFTVVVTPDDVGIVSVAFVSSYVICVVAQGYDMNGRFYWIEPAETTIDPLNFATAERAPDPIYSVRAVGDQFWLLGTNSTEVWYPTGDLDAPFARVQGRLFDRGVWGGTDAQIKDSVMLVDNDGIVYRITGGGPQRVSNNSIEERIREAIILASFEPIL